MIHATFIPTKFGWNQSMMRIETPAFEAELVLGSWRRNWQLFPGESTLLGIWPSSHQSGLSKCLEYLEYTWHIIRRFGGEGGMSIPTKARQFNTNESTKMIGQNRLWGTKSWQWIQNHDKIMNTKSPLGHKIQDNESKTGQQNHDHKITSGKWLASLTSSNDGFAQTTTWFQAQKTQLHTAGSSTCRISASFFCLKARFCRVFLHNL